MATALGPDNGSTGSRISRLGRARAGKDSGADRPSGASRMPGQGAGRAGGPKRELRRQKRAARRERLSQIRAAYTMTKRGDPRIGWILAGIGLGIFLVFVLLGLFVNHPIYFGILGLLTALAAMAVVFGRRAQRAAYAQMEGQLGAAAGVLQGLRRGWTVTPAVAVTRAQDVVHRAVGRPGIVLVGEGSPTRVATLLAQEKKRMNRVLPDVPVHDLQAGTGEGQVPLRRLEREITKLPRHLRPPQVTEIDRRLTAMGAMKVPVPKGPMPKGARMPRNPRAPRG